MTDPVPLTDEELAAIKVRMAPLVSVADYGAVPDGVTDCTFAFQAAADVSEARHYASRLIADLRASRAEAEELKARLDIADNAVMALLAEVADLNGHSEMAVRLDTYRVDI